MEQELKEELHETKDKLFVAQQSLEENKRELHETKVELIEA
jgi:hypothetical protein